MSFQAMAWAVKQQYPAPKKCLLLMMANYCGPEGSIWPSYNTLAKDSGMSRRSVIRYMEEFEREGIIRRVRRKSQSREGREQNDTNEIFLRPLESGWCHSDTRVVTESHQGGDRESPGWCHSDTRVVTESHQGGDTVSPNTINDTIIDTVTDTETNREKPEAVASGKNPDADAPADQKDPPADAGQPDQSEKISPPKADPIPYLEIVRLYHEILPEMQRCVKLTPKRKGYIRARWKQDGMDDLDCWEQYFKAIRDSKFLMGRMPPGPGRNKPFLCSLEWITNPSNFVLICEGKYHGGKPILQGDLLGGV